VRLLFYNHASEIGGAEHGLLAIMESARAAGHDIVLCAPPGPLTRAARRLDIHIVPVAPLTLTYTTNPVVLAGSLARAVAPAADVQRAVRDFAPAVVHANSIRSGLIAALAVRGRVARPRPGLVVHVRDALHTTLLDRLTAAFIGREADTIVAISRYTTHNSRWAPDKLAVIHNAIEPGTYRAAPAAGRALRRAHAIPLDAPLVAVIAQLTPWKGHADALEAVALLRQTRPDAHLAIVGAATFTGKHRRYDTAAYRAALHARAAAPDLAGHVHFTGDVAAVAAVYAAADLLLVPSWAEPFGRVVIEAMAAGVPVLATRAGGVPEIITHEADGWLTPPRDPAAMAAALRRLLDDPALRAALAARARATVDRRFALNEYSDALTGLWARLSEQSRT